MDATRWRRIDEIYQAACEREPEERPAYLAAACAGDQDLRREVESLLAQPSADGVLDRPLWNAQPGPESMLGRTISRYQILEKLGAGGMGEVWKARDILLGRLVALKLLPAGFDHDPLHVLRFEREARASAALNHAGIAAVYDTGEHEGVRYIVCELIEGGTLRALLAAGPLPVRRTVEIATEVAEALAAAHDAGIVHRDLKPENIMITRGGRVKILDFGLARRIALPELPENRDDPASFTLTPHGALVGTPGYMSPEQVRGEAADHRTDIFSFGSLLYELLTGRRAFSGASAVEVMNSILKEEPPTLPPIEGPAPSELESIMRRCLEKNPEQRFQAAADLAFHLKLLSQTSASGVASRPSARRTGWIYALTALLVVASVAGVLSLWRKSPLPAPAQPGAPIPVTALPGSELNPTLSPDGNQVAFSWDGPDRIRHIYIQMIGGGTPLRLTDNPQPDMNPSWSPDGQQVAFVRSNQGVFVISALGGSERKVTAAGSSLCWTADSRALIIASRKSPSGPSRLQIVSLENGSAADLTSPPPGSSGDSYPAVSPDGKSVALIRRANWVPADVYVVPITGGEPKRVTRHQAVMYGVAWTSDGRAVVFSSDYQLTGSWRLWRATVDGAPDEPAQPVPGVERMAKYPAISKANGPGGSRLVYQSNLVDPNIWALPLPDPRRRPAQPGKPRRIIASTLEDVTPQFSPDGARISFGSNRTGYWELYTSAPDGSGLTQLTSFRGPHVGSARWSPDGKQLAFNVNPTPHRYLWTVQSDGSGRKRLMSGDYVDARAAYSNDGRWIFFRSNRSGSDQIWRVAAQGGEPLRITAIGGVEPIAAPDGMHVYYTRVNEPGLWSVRIGGGPEVRLLDRVRHSYWTVRGSGVYFFDFEDVPDEGPFPVMFWAPGGSTVIRLAQADGPVGRVTPGFDVSPDGRTLVWARYDQMGTDLMMIENFR